MVISVLVTVLSVNAQENTKAGNIDRLMTYCNARGFFTGVILVAENQKIIYKKAFGYADIETGTALQTDHQFYLGSVSKQFTYHGCHDPERKRSARL